MSNRPAPVRAEPKKPKRSARLTSLAAQKAALQPRLDAVVRSRRRLVLGLNLVTIAILSTAMGSLLALNGMTGLEWAMLVAFVVSLPWTSIGLWNSIIGLSLELRHGKGAAAHVTPQLSRLRKGAPITTRIAVVMPLRNEDPDHSLGYLRRIEADLALTPWADCFEFHVLSDTDRPNIALREEAGVARWRRDVAGVRLSYHRRVVNTGYKSGNIAEFLDRTGGRYDFFLPLDADSLMGADTILNMVRIMQASPEVGTLQSLVTGMPSRTFFTRAFQFGMRHGMRSYTLGAAWWQADCGPNWGHNILIRTAPFHDHCMLPTLPGRGPLSGPILSHDQIEAVLMRRAGFETRVMAYESESYEENPPSITDFIRRELRWCNGNLQYLRLLGMPGLKPLSRIQVWLAIQMYIAPVAWIVFLMCGAAGVAVPGVFEGVPLWAGMGMFAVMMAMTLAPKVMGVAQVLTSPLETARYGGRTRVVTSAVAETLVSLVVAPVVAFAITRFVVGLSFGKRIGWTAQQRTRAYLGWGEAARVLWPQTLAGSALCLWFWAMMPAALWFAAPILVAWTLAVPIAVVTAWPPLGAWAQRLGLFDIPEDRQAVPALAAPDPLIQPA